MQKNDFVYLLSEKSKLHTGKLHTGKFVAFTYAKVQICWAFFLLILNFIICEIIFDFGFSSTTHTRS